MKPIIYILTVITVLAAIFLAGIAFIHVGPGPLAQRFLLAAMFILLLSPVSIPITAAITGRLLQQQSKTPSAQKPAFDIHSWLGVTLGAALFVVCFTGSVAMLEDELAIWENPSLRLDASTPWIDTNEYGLAIADHAKQHGEIYYTYVSFPRHGKPYFDFAVQIPGENARRLGLFEQRHPRTGERLSISGSHLSKWLRDLHSDLSLRRFNGRYVVGVLGLMMMTLIASGILIHAKLIANLFVWRLDSPAPMRWRDSHNALAVWSLLFAFILAYTGGAIALIKPLLPVLTASAFPSEPPALSELFDKLPPRSGVSAPMMNFDELIAQAQTHLQNKQLLSMRVFNWGDENARAIFLWRHETALAYPSRLELNAVTGELVSISTTENGGYAGRIHAVLAPLHFGLFGGNAWGAAAMKFLYAALGLACAITCSTGVSLWLEKRRKQVNDRRRGDKFLIGVCAGSVLATSFTILGYKASTILGLDMQPHIGRVFCLAWGASIISAMIMRHDVFVYWLLLRASAACLFGAAALDFTLTEHGRLSAATAINITFMAAAAGLLLHAKPKRVN